MNVRRLAAIDMSVLHGTTRRRIVLTEFVLGVLVMVAAGIAILVTASSISGRVLGWWMTDDSGRTGAPDYCRRQDTHLAVLPQDGRLVS